tara:strand:+ start:405 stop:857 length:453 start_codon:yes stop_codon:yes gene_type:complete
MPFLDNINTWLLISLILYIFELISFTGFFFWLGNAAVITWLLGLLIPSLSVHVLILVFSTMLIINVFLWRHFLRKTSIVVKSNGHVKLNRRAESYIGKKLTLDQPLINGSGKCVIGDSIWNVEAQDDYPAGTKVVVESVDSTILHVKKID